MSETTSIDELWQQVKGLQRALSARDVEIAKLEGLLRNLTRGSERLSADRNGLAAKLEDSLRQWSVRIDAAETRAIANAVARNKFRAQLLRLVLAVEDEKADEDAYWRHLDEVAKEARRLLFDEYARVSRPRQGHAVVDAERRAEGMR